VKEEKQPEVKMENLPQEIVDISGLPLEEVESKTSGDYLAVFYSGDGGWAGIDKSIAGGLADAGISVVGVSSLKYFWNEKSLKEVGEDLQSIIAHYSKKFNRKKVMLIGYSFGADTLTHTYNQLPETVKEMVSSLILLGPGLNAKFVFNIGDWLSSSSSGKYEILPELSKVKNTKVLCIYGEEESESLCPKTKDLKFVETFEMSGGHHFGGDYEKIVQRILKEL
jgi:type IV secretory pathway VirJ component